jgi:hypothetical protein
MHQMLGLVAMCKVRHVYAADRYSVMLINSAGQQTADDLTIQLPVRAQTIERPGDPPLLVLKLYDPNATGGHTSMAEGPCPSARTFARKLVQGAKAALVHVPVPARHEWLSGLQPGSIELGDLYLLPEKPDPRSIAIAMPSTAVSLSRALIEAGMAKARSTDAA